MRKLLATILIFTTVHAFPAHATPAEEESALCSISFLTPPQIKSLIAERLNDYREELKPAKKVLTYLFANTIKEEVLNRCLALKNCTEYDIMLSILDETDRVFTHSRRNAGLTALSTFWGAGVALVIGLGKLSKNPAISVVTANEVSGITNIFREPVDLLYKPKIKKLAYRLATGQQSTAREQNAGWVNQTIRDRAAFNDGEAGKGSHQGFRNDVLNSVQTIQNRYLMKSMAEMMPEVVEKTGVAPPVTDRDLAREWASLFFFTRHYYANIDIKNPQVAALIRPLVAPFQDEVNRLTRLIGEELHILERNEINVQHPGRYNYDQAQAKEYYELLLLEWFNRPHTELRDPRSVFD